MLQEMLTQTLHDKQKLNDKLEENAAQLSIMVTAKDLRDVMMVGTKRPLGLGGAGLGTRSGNKKVRDLADRFLTLGSKLDAAASYSP